MQSLFADSLIEIMVFQEGLLHHTPDDIQAQSNHIRTGEGSTVTDQKIITKKAGLTAVCFTKGPLDMQLFPPACHTQPLSWFRGVYTRYNSYCPLGGAPEKKKKKRGMRDALHT